MFMSVYDVQRITMANTRFMKVKKGKKHRNPPSSLEQVPKLCLPDKFRTEALYSKADLNEINA